MPSILFWNNNNNTIHTSPHSSSSSKDKISNFFSSFNNNNNNNKNLLQKQEKSNQVKNLLNKNIPLLLEQPDPIQIQCDYTLFQTVLSNQENDELLWRLAKRLKQQEDMEEEPSSSSFMNEQQQQQQLPHSQAICYRRAIRILIYYFRAHHYHPKYYKKCIQVPEPCSCCPSDVQETISEIQHSATNKSIDTTTITTTHTSNKFLTTSSRTMSVSSYSTNSSYASSTSSNCSHCGIEKRAMPVCARCKSQAYCSNKCRMAHQPIHQRECNNSQ
ncbi:hypothetical protein INT45_010637 [Circinella minor]|uniref:MYND-type domain-containing protein n=1 Tax=Circinella minor TaxID=1195481 RepID=A0A8H7VGX2_9FUNG|nr:hypothetical protein INT45_010637 [Circinella minor]